MANEQITVNSDDLDNAVFGVAEQIADKTPGLTVRDKMRLTLDISDQIMLAVNSITEAGRRSAAGKKAAEARYAKPKPGPAIPQTTLQVPVAPVPAAPFQATKASLAEQKQAAPAPVPGNFLQQPDVSIPPPPHPALAPGQTPFGAPPA